MTAPTSLPQKRMLLIAAAQGIALLCLKSAFESGYWPSESPLWSFPLWTLALAVPVLLLLSIERTTVPKLLRYVGLFALVLTLAAVYIGAQARPYGEFPVSTFAYVFAISIALACFKALMYLQQRAADVPLSYQVLFTYSWRNALTLALALLLTGVFWLILQLWGALFSTIGIEFFERLFDMDWFVIPILAIAHGVGIIIFRNLTQVIDSITRLLQGLIKLLLPLVVSIAVIFVVSLPFVGLDALWETGRGTSLLLWLFAISLFFVNAVYQDGRGDKPYPAFLHRALYAGLCVTPILSALSFYGLLLRVDQYGLTVARCWAFVVWLVLTLFAAGYVIGILRRRDRWTEDLARVNTVMGLVVLALMLLANSPLLDFRKLAIASQLARLESGATEPRDFDFWYARTALARPGYLALEKLQDRYADEPEILELIRNPQRPFLVRTAVDQDDFWAGVRYRPEPFEVPETVKRQIGAQAATGENLQSVLIRVDVDEDGSSEYVLAHLYNGNVSSGWLYYRDGGGWKSAMMTARMPPGVREDRADDVLHGEISLQRPQFNDVVIGDVTFRVGQPELTLWRARETDADEDRR